VDVTTFTENGESIGGITVDHTVDQIVVNDGGLYRIAFEMCFKGTAAALFTVAAAVLGTENERIAAKASGTGTELHIGAAGLLTLSSGDDVSLRVKSNGAGNSITPVFASLMVQQLSQTAI